MAKAKQKNPNLFTIKFKSFEEIREKLITIDGNGYSMFNSKNLTVFSDDCCGLLKCVGKEFQVDLSKIIIVEKDAPCYGVTGESLVAIDENYFEDYITDYPWFGLPIVFLSNQKEFVKACKTFKIKYIIKDMDIGDGDYKLSLNNQGVIEVGCQTITKEQTKEIYKHLKKIFE